MKIHTRPLPPLPYERAPSGSPDTYRLTRDVIFRWERPPRWAARMFAGAAVFVPTEGSLRMSLDAAGAAVLILTVFKGFHFSVSVAPDFGRALAGACLHDFLYEYAAQIAAALGCTRRSVLRLADHWFLAQMRSSGFLLKRTYFCAVRIFGYPFNSLFSRSTP